MTCLSEHEPTSRNYDRIRAARVAGRKITALGGGTGLSTLLLGLKEYTDNITAIVTVTDDGGGSGIIRQEFGILPPGDIRNCILALANTSTTMSELLSYRFSEGSLQGQSFGNLFLLALTGICGSFESAVARMNQFLAVTGQVLPVTNQDVTLKATFENGCVVYGETAITAAKKNTALRIEQIELEPARVTALDSVIAAIDEADVILLGPGSLYTSVIPNLLVGRVSEALRRSKALRIYVMNLMTQDGETEGYSAAQHVEAIHRHAGGNVVDLCVYNTQPIPKKLKERYALENSTQLFPSADRFRALGVELFGGQMLSLSREYVRHDPLRLAYHILCAADRYAPRSGAFGEYDKYLLSQE